MFSVKITAKVGPTEDVVNQHITVVYKLLLLVCIAQQLVAAVVFMHRPAYLTHLTRT